MTCGLMLASHFFLCRMSCVAYFGVVAYWPHAGRAVRAARAWKLRFLFVLHFGLRAML